MESQYIVIQVTDDMENDLRECNELAKNNIDKKCEECSLNGGTLGCLADSKWVTKRKKVLFFADE